MTTTSTRRAVLAGAAAVPVSALPTIAYEHDPVFDAIERHQEAYDAFIKACKSSGVSDEMTEEIHELETAGMHGHLSNLRLAALVKVTPTTVAGCAALLRYITECQKQDDESLFQSRADDVRVPARDLLSRIAATLEGSTAA
jgi:hypothetical protein